MKIAFTILFFAALTFCRLPISAQNQAVYKADLLVRKGKTVETKPVEISLENDRIAIRSGKKTREERFISFSEIQTAEYTFSNRPRYTAATLGALAFGLSAFPVFFMKTKKNWLSINAGENSAILQLQSENYRMFLLGLQNKNVKIYDLGNRDDQEDDSKQNKAPKSANKSSPDVKQN
jgi:hypothetical protein